MSESVKAPPAGHVDLPKRPTMEPAPTNLELPARVRGSAPTVPTVPTTASNNARQVEAQDDGMGRRLRPNAVRIPCPFLATAYNQGDLNPAADGTIDTQQLIAVMAKVGFSQKATKIFVDAADDTTPEVNSFNLFDMRNNALNHTGSSGARDMSVDPERLQYMLGFATNGRMYRENVATAVNDFASNPVGQGSLARGTAITTLEFTTVLEVFGRKDEHGKLYLTETDITGLWLRNEYPKGWTPRPENDIQLGALLESTGKTGLARVWDWFLRAIHLRK